jgi:hypothetical protein
MNIKYSEAKIKERIRLVSALPKWFYKCGIKPTIAVCLHTPMLMRFVQKGYDDIWLERINGVYLNQLDRRIFKAAHRNRNLRLKRYVFLEHKDTVGWHTHFVTETPPNMTIENTICLMEKLWLKQCKNYTNPKFIDRLFWAEEIKGNYEAYIQKHIFNEDGTTIGKLDIKNTVIGN